MKIIKTIEGFEVKVSDIDYPFINSCYELYLNEGGYVLCKLKIRNMGLPTGQLHKIIMEHYNSGRSIVVDHRSGNKLDNTRDNLRICTHQENMRNSNGDKNKQSSKYKGVFWNKRDKVWYTLISLNDTKEYLGTFDDEEVAANCYNYYAKKYYKEFARLNDVPYMTKDEWMSKSRGTGKTSNYRGVSLIRGKWAAQIWDSENKKNIKIGEYITELEAALAYNKKAIELKGDKAKLNKLNQLEVFKMNKDIAITYLKEINKGKSTSEIVTRLYYNNDGDYVQDFSYFADKNYMSEGLLEAFQNGQTLTTAQEDELQHFIIEKSI